MIVFLDHSPSELFESKGPDTIHTSAMLFSWNIPNLISLVKKEILEKTQCSGFKKFSSPRGRLYKKVFKEAFFKNLPSFEGYIHIFSFHAKVIRKMEPVFLETLKLNGGFQKVSKDGKIFFNGRLNNGDDFSLKEKDYFTILYLSYFIVTAHESSKLIEEKIDPNNNDHDRTFFADKFPQDGPIGSWIQGFLNHYFNGSRNIQIVNFKETDVQDSDLFIDNLAGLFSSNDKNELLELMEEARQKKHHYSFFWTNTNK